VQAIEKQRVKPQFRTLQALAKAFKVDAGELDG
jgi:DNA-binding XRE family transcriptional regulator